MHILVILKDIFLIPPSTPIPASFPQISEYVLLHV